MRMVCITTLKSNLSALLPGLCRNLSILRSLILNWLRKTKPKFLAHSAPSFPLLLHFFNKLYLPSDVYDRSDSALVNFLLKSLICSHWNYPVESQNLPSGHGSAVDIRWVGQHVTMGRMTMGSHDWCRVQMGARVSWPSRPSGSS